MDDARLVRLVVAEVLKRLKLDGSASVLLPEGKRVRVLAPRSPETEDRLKALLAGRFGKDVCLVFNDDITESIESNGQGGEDAFVCRLVPRLACPDLADLALGTAHTGDARRILAQMCRGHALEVVSFEHLELGNTLPHKLFSLYEGYRKTLESFGVTTFRARIGCSTRLQARLVTAREVEEAASEGLARLVHGADALVTPLARDMAEGLGITLVKDGDIS